MVPFEPFEPYFQMWFHLVPFEPYFQMWFHYNPFRNETPMCNPSLSITPFPVLFKLEFKQIISLLETHRRPFIDPLETYMPDRRPIGDEGCQSPTKNVSRWLRMSVSNGSPIRHVDLLLASDEACWGLRWVSNQACRSPMGHVGLRWGMSVSDGACRSPMGLRW